MKPGGAQAEGRRGLVATVAALGLFTLLVAPVSGTEPEWLRAAPGYDWSFPEDHFSHDGYRNEWWYVTGHLETETDPPRRLGFQFTIFRVGLTPDPPRSDSAWSAANLVMGHAAIGDEGRGSHRFSEVLYRESPLLAGFGETPGPRIAWSLGPPGTPEPWTIDWNGDGFDIAMSDRAQGIGFRLVTRATRPLVFQGPGGYSRKAATVDAASLYYSYTRMSTTGTVELDGRSVPVRGTAWADREIGSGQLARHQSGWDWFSLQLRDGRDVMLYLLRDASGGVDFGKGTVVDPDGEVRRLDAGDWTLRPTGHWESPTSGARYPSGWEIEVPEEELSFRVVPTFDAQENVSTRSGIAYWEGAVRVKAPSGAVLGVGYVELTGYGENNRPAL